MKSNLNYRVCEFSSATSNCLNCVASFYYLYDVVLYMMLNKRAVAVFRRNDKNLFVRSMPDDLVEYVNQHEGYFVATLGAGCVSAFIDRIKSDGERM